MHVRPPHHCACCRCEGVAAVAERFAAHAALCVADSARDQKALAILGALPTLVPKLLSIAHNGSGQAQKHAPIALGRLAKNPHSMDKRRDLFESLGCQDMKGLLVTDRGLAAHMSKLANEVRVKLPKHRFIPEPPHLGRLQAFSWPETHPARKTVQSRPRDAPNGRLRPLILGECCLAFYHFQSCWL